MRAAFGCRFLSSSRVSLLLPRRSTATKRWNPAIIRHFRNSSPFTATTTTTSAAATAKSLFGTTASSSSFSPFHHRAPLRCGRSAWLRLFCLGSLTTALALVAPGVPLVLAQEPDHSRNNAPARTTGTAAAASAAPEESDGGDALEKCMLEASERDRKARSAIPEDLSLIRKLVRSSVLFVVDYIIEPIATGYRFITLVAIFAPVILAVPCVYLGGRLSDKSVERTGTLWWYGFLVRSLERAGPTFIKVCCCPSTIYNTFTLF